MNDNTFLHRQIHPSWIQNHVVSSQAFLLDNNVASLSFTPSLKDANKLSVYNGEKFTPEESYNHYTKQFISAAVLSVKILEVNSVSDLTVLEDNDPFDGHTIIDYSKVASATQITKKAKKLKNFAVSRGWTHKPL